MTPFLHTGDPGPRTTDPPRLHVAGADRPCSRPTGSSCKPRASGKSCSPGAFSGSAGFARAWRRPVGMHRRRPQSGPMYGACDRVIFGHLANNSFEKGHDRSLAGANRSSGSAALEAPLFLAGPEMPSFRNFWETFSGRHPGACSKECCGWVCSTRRRRTFSPASTCSRCRAGRTRSGWCCRRRGPTACRVGYRAGGVADVIRDGLRRPAGALRGRGVACGGAASCAAVAAAFGDDSGRPARDRVGRDFRWKRSWTWSGGRMKRRWPRHGTHASSHDRVNGCRFNIRQVRSVRCRSRLRTRLLASRTAFTDSPSSRATTAGEAPSRTRRKRLPCRGIKVVPHELHDPRGDVAVMIAVPFLAQSAVGDSSSSRRSKNSLVPVTAGSDGHGRSS